MYRALQQKINIDDIIKVEYDLKISRKYRLDKDLFDDYNIFRHLKEIYTKVVKPLTNDIKSLMIEK